MNGYIQPEVEKKLRRNLAILANKQGQQRSMEEMLPVGPDGEPVPWYTYPALENLVQFDFSACTIFEYGCGYSSLWWAARAKQVYTVDHNGNWIEKIRPHVPRNLELIHEAEKDAYVAAIEHPGTHFDVVIIDGRWRLACSEKAPAFLNLGGMIIFDNTDWYVEAPATISALGFSRIDFSGFGPINNYCWTTSLFLKSSLGITRKRSFTLPVGGLVRNGDWVD